MHNNQHLTGSGGCDTEKTSVHGDSGPTLAPGLDAMQTTGTKLRIDCPKCAGNGTLPCESDPNLYNVCDNCGGTGKPKERVEGDEVFARSEIPFDVALEVVRKEMERALQTVIAQPGKTQLPSVEFELLRWDSDDRTEARWRVVKCISESDSTAGTLGQAIAGLANSREKAIEAARQRKADAEAELARLEIESRQRLAGLWEGLV